MKVCTLSDRSFLLVSGDDAMALLERIITQNPPARTAMKYAALLTPQGKVETDFFLWRTGEQQCVLDVATARAELLASTLLRYRLRARVGIEPSADHIAVAAWQPSPPAGGVALPAPCDNGTMLAAADTRHRRLGYRYLVTASGGGGGAPAIAAIARDLAASEVDQSEFTYHRFGIGVVDAGEDLPSRRYFSHELDMIGSGAIALNKGCYIGQEVVSRVYHRRSEAAAEGNSARKPKQTTVLAATADTPIALAHHERLAALAGKKVYASASAQTTPPRRAIGEVLATCRDRILLLYQSKTAHPHQPPDTIYADTADANTETEQSIKLTVTRTH